MAWRALAAPVALVASSKHRQRNLSRPSLSLPTTNHRERDPPAAAPSATFFDQKGGKSKMGSRNQIGSLQLQVGQLVLAERFLDVLMIM